jgi:hypothetical protein
MAKSGLDLPVNLPLYGKPRLVPFAGGAWEAQCRVALSGKQEGPYWAIVSYGATPKAAYSMLMSSLGKEQ